jgi:hypothetical protein
LSSNLGDGLAHLSFDKEFQNRRKDSAVTGVADGFKKGGKQLARGLFEGITGIVVQPLKGAEKDGVKGFAKGLAQGIVGVAVKPVTGEAVKRTREPSRSGPC